MLKKSNDNIERFFKKAVAHQDTTFRESDWQKMEKMLDEKDHERATIRSKQIKQATYSLIAISIISLSVYFLAFNPDGSFTSEKESSKKMQAVVGAEAPKDEANQKNPTADLLPSVNVSPATESTDSENKDISKAIEAGKRSASDADSKTLNPSTPNSKAGEALTPSKETTKVNRGSPKQSTDSKLIGSQEELSNTKKLGSVNTDLPAKTAINDLSTNTKEKSIPHNSGNENIVRAPKHESLVISKSSSEDKKSEKAAVQSKVSQPPLVSGEIQATEVGKQGATSASDTKTINTSTTNSKTTETLALSKEPVDVNKNNLSKQLTDTKLTDSESELPNVKKSGSIDTELIATKTIDDINATTEQKSILQNSGNEKTVLASKPESLVIQESDSKGKQSEKAVPRSGSLPPVSMGNIQVDEVSNDANVVTNGDQLSNASNGNKNAEAQNSNQNIANLENLQNTKSTSVDKDTIGSPSDRKMTVKEQDASLTTPLSEFKDLVREPSRWSAAIVMAPDFSSTALGKYTSPGESIGIMGEFRFLKRLSIRSGMLRSTKKYVGEGQDYQPPDGYWERRTNGVIPEEINGACLVYEIPIILQYTLVQKEKFRVSIGAGVSSYVMDNQSYKYTFEYPNPGAATGWSTSKSSSYPFKIGHVSVAYERNISKKFGIGLEPYLKVPFAEMGWSNIDLYSSGILINLRYRFFKKTE